MELSTELILGLVGLGGTGGIGGTIIAYFKYKGYKETKETKEAARDNALISALKSQSDLNAGLFSEMLTTLKAMDHTLFMGFRQKVNNSHEEITQLKKLAWGKQQDDLYNGLKRIIRANSLEDQRARISDIRDLLETIIRDTDETLNRFNIKDYMAPTAEKILFVCGGEAPRVLYKIITNPKMADHQRLEDNIRNYGRQILNSVKSEFYDSKGRAIDA